MKKRKHPLTPEMIDEAGDFVESVLIEDGFMLPTRPGQLTSDDIERYGHGQPRLLAELKRDAAAIEGRSSASRTGNADVEESLAMAARNGDQIREEVWARMRSDRKRAEEGSKDDG